MRRIAQLLTLALLSIVVAGCGTAPTKTDTPEATATASPPSAEPTAATPATPVIPTDAYARIDASGVPIGETPGASPDRTMSEGPLPIGLLVYVVQGPVSIDGVDWYLIATTYSPDQDQFYPSGWVPEVGEDGMPALRPEIVYCPPLPADLDAMIALQKPVPTYFEVACFGGEEIRFEARIGQIESECWEPWGVEPEWLGCNVPAAYLVPLAPDPDDPLIYPAFAPGVDTAILPHPDAPAPLPIVEIRGIFDHPAAQDCRNRLNYESEPEPIPALTILGCRTQFVVTAMRAIRR